MTASRKGILARDKAFLPEITFEQYQLLFICFPATAVVTAGDGLVADAERVAYGREQWQRCEALTAGLAGELTEQLRLILEPTQASKLTGVCVCVKICITPVLGYWGNLLC